MITFDEMVPPYPDLSHGDVISKSDGTGDFIKKSFPGVEIWGFNFHEDFNIAAIYDSDDTHSADPDLEFSSFGGDWKDGNLKGVHLGNVLIISENDEISDGVVNADDEGRRGLGTGPDGLPAQGAGTLTFIFSHLLTSIGFDLIDVEPRQDVFPFADMEPFSVTLHPTVGSPVTIDSSGLAPAFGTLTFGDNTANRIAPLTASELGIAPFDKVVFNLGGSGAVDTLQFTMVPEPGTVALLGLGLIALFGSSRRHRNRT